MEEGKATNEEPAKDNADEGSGSEESAEEDVIPQDELDNNLLNACRENHTEEVLALIEKKDKKNSGTANPLFEKDGWNPLLWAACNGNETLVRALIKHNACAPYLN